jgi:hypothetical protein
MGPLLLARLLDLNDVQEGALNIAFRIADDQGLALLDFKDLRAILDAIAPFAPKKEAGSGLDLDAGEHRMDACRGLHVGGCIHAQSRRTRSCRHLLSFDVRSAESMDRLDRYTRLSVPGGRFLDGIELGLCIGLLADP